KSLPSNHRDVPLVILQCSFQSLQISVDLVRLLTGNDVPEPSEISSVLRVISDCQARLDVLDFQIESLQTILAQLSSERNETADCLRQSRAIVSPVRRVPPEILCEIFALTLPWDRRVSERTAHQPPWRLGHVCAPWRQAAIAYPALW
ncbi:hypothetical protein DFH09DRAFT_984160, partial [Mycena vulgaris]